MVTNNFFDLVGDNFFTPFYSANKRYNYELLQLINKKMSLDNLQVVRDEIIEWIVDYIENSSIELFDDETNEYKKDPREFAGAKIRYFVKCGWLIEDYEGLKATYQMDENGIKMLSAMENIVKDDTKSLEFSGYVYNIYNNLNHYSHEHAVDIIEQIDVSRKQLNSMLRGLNVNIKKFLTKLISENEAKPKEILQTIFFDYQKKVVLKAFKNFREKDNPSKYKLAIEKKIDNLLSGSNMQKMVANYIQIKCDGIDNEENRMEAKEFFEPKLLAIKDQFEEIEDYIQMLDSKNTKYIVTARRRLNFLLNEETDIEGRIVECLKGMAKVDNDFFDDVELDLFKSGNLDEHSLYKPITRNRQTNIEDILENQIEDLELLDTKFKNLFKDNAYSVSEINKFILNIMGSTQQVHLRDIAIHDFDDLLKTFLVQVYSQNKDIDYQIQYVNEKFESIGYVFNDCIIERKK